MSERVNRYEIDLRIDTSNQILQADVHLKQHVTNEVNKLTYYIHKNLELKKLSCNIPIEYKMGIEVEQWCPFVLESRKIEIVFQEALIKEDLVELRFEYEGQIGIVTEYGVNRLTEEWIELGLYSPWYPLNETLEQASFKVNIEINDAYEIVNAECINGIRILEQVIPYADCTVIASNRMKHLKATQTILDAFVYYVNDEHKELAQRILKYLEVILDRYNNLGTTENKKNSVVIAPRDDGGGYCRPGLIVVTPQEEQETEEDYYKYIAHETAHLWWNKCKLVDTWEDWLNESFAEMSALMALRDCFGDNVFQSKLEAYKNKSKGLPAIRNIDRSHESAFQVLYMKGPLILCEMEAKFGREWFEEFLHQTHINKVSKTEELLCLLEKSAGHEAKVALSNMLEQ